jgi:hypothetical protein
MAVFYGVPNEARDQRGNDAAFTIYEARKIITMNPARPYATHVAVRILRAKGFVRDLDGRRVTIQIVGARREVAPSSREPGDRDGPAGRDGLVAIGLKGRIDLGAIAEIVAAAQSAATRPPSSAA